MAMINLYRANVIGIKWNCLYPNHVEVTDEREDSAFGSNP